MSGAPEDALLTSLAGAQALRLALGAGLVDRLLPGPQPVAALAATARIDPDGLRLLAGLLPGVVTLEADTLALTDGFRALLPRRKALETRLDFLALAAHDVLEHLPAMLFDTAGYVRSGRVFELFRYDRAMRATPEDIAFTRRWVDYTTVLTEDEAPLLVPSLPLDGVARLLDVGGNSGAFALALCAARPELQVTVLDLPAVVAIGGEHVAARPEAPRITFVASDARRAPLPTGHDAVCFKSVLHDWPDADAILLLDAARAALPPGGRLFIVERGRFRPEGPLPYSALANLVFSPFYRAPERYVAWLAERDFDAVEVTSVEIEMPFHIISARRGGAA